MRPLHDRDRLMQELARVEEYRLTLVNQGYFPDFLFDDFTTEARLIEKSGSVLTEVQFGRIRSASSIVNSLLRFLRERAEGLPALYAMSHGLKEGQEIIELIDAVIDQQGTVRNNASPELNKIRSALHTLRKEADRRFRSYINDLKKRGWLRDNEENFYNYRRVLAVPSEHKRDIRGIIHGKSESGKTTFIEPEALIELNNDIAELEQDERAEVMRLLRELTGRLHPFADVINRQLDFLVNLDAVRAKARFSVDIDARLPHLDKDPSLHLIRAVHPLLFLQNRSAGKPVVPLTLSLDENQRIVVISGPNAGGKSITLKTVGLLQLMMQSGLPVPVAEGSSMSLFNHLLADIGDSQSIEYALSTYSSRLIKMNHFLRMATGRSLVLIDEFGTGTDPELGGAIAEVILEELNRKHALGVFTTHYTNIKLLADRLEGTCNASMLFNPETLQPLFVLSVGEPGSSYTFEVAERIGLPRHVLERARKKVQRDKIRLNDMLGELQQQKHRLEVELTRLKQKQDKSEAAEEKFEQLSERLSARLDKEKEKQEENRKLAELGRRLRAWSEEWEKSKDKKAVIKKMVGTITAENKKRAAENTPEKVSKRRQQRLEKLRGEIALGSQVRILQSKQTGTVIRIQKDLIHIDCGNLLAKVNLENLEIVRKETESESAGKK